MKPPSLVSFFAYTTAVRGSFDGDCDVENLELKLAKENLEFTIRGLHAKAS